MTIIEHEVPFFETCAYETNATDIGVLTGATSSAPQFHYSAFIPPEAGCFDERISGTLVYTGTTNFNVAAGWWEGNVAVAALRPPAPSHREVVRAVQDGEPSGNTNAPKECDRLDYGFEECPRRDSNPRRAA
jgi:hypothetical protein